MADSLETNIASLEIEAPAEGQRTPVANGSASACPFPHDSDLSSAATTDASCPIMTQEVDPELLRTSLEDRINYVKDFIMFGKADQEILNKVAPMVNDMIPQVVDDLYAKLFEFDITKQV